MMRKIKTGRVGLFLIAVIILAGCAPAAAPAAEETQEPTPLPTAETISLTDGLGRTVTLAEPAQRVISLAPSNTEILFAIGAGAQVVGRDEFSDYPVEAQDIPSVGGSFGEYNSEAIISLNPDLVLAAEINPPDLVETLEELGLTVYYLSNPLDMEGMYDNLNIVGSLTGRMEEAAALVASLKDRVAAVDQKISGVQEKPLVFYELDSTDPNAPYTAGPGTFVDLLIQRAGGENIGSQLEGAWAQISSEELLTQDPDIILLGDALFGVTVESVKARPGWEALTAVKTDQIFPFDDNLVSRPGPRLVEGLEKLAEVMHP
ncbi:MAG: cobalamin-binding protein [Chloroflexi bacterium]|nr:MAG: cobalamin-binding protein [Chloroflexota bacterium]